MKAIALASLAALAIQPVVFLLWFGLQFFLSSEPFPIREAGLTSLLVVAFAAAHLVLLGLPLFYLLWRSNRLNWLSVGLAGLFTGVALISILSLPLRDSSSDYSSSGTWHGQYHDFVVHGVPTRFGWLRYGEGLLFFGLHGVAGALAFYYAWLRLRPNNSFKPKPLRGSA